MNTPTTQFNKDHWWFSTDGKRGFHWDSIRGFDFKPGGEGMTTANLYLYVEAGIFQLSGHEANEVLKLVKEKFPKL